MTDVPAGDDARILTTLEIDLDSQDPALLEKLAVLKPLLLDILQTVEDLVCPAGFSKVLSGTGGFHKVTYTEICK